MTKKFHIKAIQKWESQEYENTSFDMSHLNAHELIIHSKKMDYKLVVTYGLHCFTKNNSPFSLPILVKDSSGDTRQFDVERYLASKELKNILFSEDILGQLRFYKSDQKRYFTIHKMNNFTNKIEPYKICVTFFKENRLLRLHVLTAYFVREGTGTEDNPIPSNTPSFTIFKLLSDLIKSPKSSSSGAKEGYR